MSPQLARRIFDNAFRNKLAVKAMLDLQERIPAMDVLVGIAFIGCKLQGFKAIPDFLGWIEQKVAAIGIDERAKTWE
ncbi:hypothetical protein [Rhizobium leguminosarum]|uniref:hypothetical protein n=1 Tax=Rhizobium leguminosarum TaxID=384 RepID=UPI001C954A63|nr:hypothetical protein [Rhizobium leguminosarum]MBY5346045.1 hypothetical protein [Rhizobium leguminosarum]